MRNIDTTTKTKQDFLGKKSYVSSCCRRNHERRSVFVIDDRAMLLFCPICANMLVVEEASNCNRFACNTCPYVRNTTKRVIKMSLDIALLLSFSLSPTHSSLSLTSWCSWVHRENRQRAGRRFNKVVTQGCCEIHCCSKDSLCHTARPSALTSLGG